MTSPSSAPFPGRWRNHAWSVGLAALLAVLLWTAIGIIVSHNRAGLRADAEGNAASGARVFAEHIRRTVTMIDLALQDYRDYHRARPDAPPGEGWRNAYLKEGGVFQWAVIGADGMMTYSNLAPVSKPVDLGDREHFRVHRDGAGDALFISKPVLGRVSRRWSIQFTRRLSRPDGSFAGVIVMSVPPEYFIANFEAIDTGAHGATLLAGMDHILRARFAGEESEKARIGQALSDAHPFFDPSLPSGVTLVADLEGEVARHTAWRQVTGFPLVVAVQVADEDVLEQAAAVERNLAVVGAVMTIVLLGGGLTIGHLLERRARALRQVERQAAELRLTNEEVERLAYVAAHDLQEPLRAITSFSQLVQRTYSGRLDEEGRQWLGEVVDATGRMKQLLRDIQFYLAEKALPLPEGTAPADAAVSAALGKLRPAVEAAGAEVEVGPLPAVPADARRLTEVFLILIGNALQYRAADRPPRIRVAARREDGFDVIDVADNGIGIEPKYFDRIFEVFQRLHGRGEHAGTGMGLAIARKMVQRLGGRIEVSSTPGQGSRFSILFPVRTIRDRP